MVHIFLHITTLSHCNINLCSSQTGATEKMMYLLLKMYFVLYEMFQVSVYSESWELTMCFHLFNNECFLLFYLSQTILDVFSKSLNIKNCMILFLIDCIYNMYKIWVNWIYEDPYIELIEWLNWQEDPFWVNTSFSKTSYLNFR